MSKILLVEDSKNVIRVMKMLLRNAGYDYKVVENGVDGVEIAFRWNPDLILLDIKLPKMNGFLVLETLKEDEKTANIPIIVLSAKAEEEDIQKATKLGANEYMTKPADPDKLLGIMEKYL